MRINRPFWKAGRAGCIEDKYRVIFFNRHGGEGLVFGQAMFRTAEIPQSFEAPMLGDDAKLRTRLQQGCVFLFVNQQLRG